MIRGSPSLVALLLLATPAVAKDAVPHDEIARQCEQHARTEAGAPPVSPRDQPNASPPSDDTLQRGRPEGPPSRRATPNPTPQDVQAEKTPAMPGSDPRETYRLAYEACLRARGR